MNILDKLFKKKPLTQDEIEHREKIKSIRTEARREYEIKLEEEKRQILLDKVKVDAVKSPKKRFNILSFFEDIGKGIDLTKISKGMEEFWSIDKPKKKE